MTDIRTVTPDFAVAPQLLPEDMAEAARRGFTLIINNRPDNEAPDQPGGEAMKAAAEAQGLAYVHIPVRGGPTQDQVQAVCDAILQTKGPVLAFAAQVHDRSSPGRWGGAQSGVASKDLIVLGQDAGYDLSGVFA